MSVGHIKVGAWQFVWWWRWPTFHYWEFPPDWKKHEVLKRPMSRGLDMGIFEIRYIPPAT